MTKKDPKDVRIDKLTVENNNLQIKLTARIDDINKLVKLIADWHTGKVDTNAMIQIISRDFSTDWQLSGGNEKYVEEAFEMSSCGTEHWTAERALRIIEATHTWRNRNPMNKKTMEVIADLADRAGVYFAKRRIRPTLQDDDLDDDVPF